MEAAEREVAAAHAAEVAAQAAAQAAALAAAQASEPTDPWAADDLVVVDELTSEELAVAAAAAPQKQQTAAEAELARVRHIWRDCDPVCKVRIVLSSDGGEEHAVRIMPL